MNEVARKEDEMETDPFQAEANELCAIENMTVNELAQKYAEVFGEPTRSRNKAYLRKKVTFRIQEIAKGGLSQEALERIDELAENAPIRRRQPGVKTEEVNNDEEPSTDKKPAKPRDLRLPAPGEILTKKYKDKTYEVRITEDDFIYAGEHFNSLSAIAKKITGTTWNGFLFFGLVRRGEKKAGDWRLEAGGQKGDRGECWRLEAGGGNV